MNRPRESNDPGRALTESVRCIQRYWKATTDGVVASGAIEKIPYANWLAAGLRGVQGFRDSLLEEKIERFFQPIVSVPDTDRKRWADDLERDPEERDRVSKHLMLVLDRQDDLRKPRLLGFLWAKYLRGDLTLRCLELGAQALDQVYAPHLATLAALAHNIEVEKHKRREANEDWDASQGFDQTALENLRTAGLVIMPNDGSWKDLGDPRYAPSDLGNTLLRCIPASEIDSLKMA